MVIYAAALGTVCAGVLTVVAGYTKPLRDANKAAEKYRNILSVFEIPFPRGASNVQLKEIFDANIIAPKESDRLKLYKYAPFRAKSQQRTVSAVAVEFAGPGLWAPIKGFLALGPQMQTIRGITFYEQAETPSLGGKIVHEGFRSGFVGKSIQLADGRVGIRIVKKGTAKGPNEIDGISGATITYNRVEAMVNDVIARIVQERDSGQ